MSLLVDAVDMLAIYRAIYGDGNFSGVSTDVLESFVDGDFMEEHERSKVKAELERRRRA